MGQVPGGELDGSGGYSIAWHVIFDRYLDLYSSFLSNAEQVCTGFLLDFILLCIILVNMDVCT